MEKDLIYSIVDAVDSCPNLFRSTSAQVLNY